MEFDDFFTYIYLFKLSYFWKLNIQKYIYDIYKNANFIAQTSWTLLPTEKWTC